MRNPYFSASRFYFSFLPNRFRDLSRRDVYYESSLGASLSDQPADFLKIKLSAAAPHSAVIVAGENTVRACQILRLEPYAYTRNTALRKHRARFRPFTASQAQAGGIRTAPYRKASCRGKPLPGISGNPPPHIADFAPSRPPSLRPREPYHHLPDKIKPALCKKTRRGRNPLRYAPAGERTPSSMLCMPSSTVRTG